MLSELGRGTSGEVDAEIRSRSLHGISISLQSCSTSSLNSKRSTGIWFLGTSPMSHLEELFDLRARNPELPEATVSYTQFLQSLD